LTFCHKEKNPINQLDTQSQIPPKKIQILFKGKHIQALNTGGGPHA